MNTQKLSRIVVAVVALVFSALLFACVQPAQPPGVPGGSGSGGTKTGPVRIGLSMDTLKEERWQRDRDLFVARAKELGAEVLVQSANGDDRVQVQQADNLLTQGVDVLVVIPHNGEVAATIVEAAKARNVPVISYDRLIRSSEPALYISFDNEKVGEMQADYLLKRAPKGNYVLIGGAPTDNNALLFRKGQMNVLKPAIDRGDVKVVSDQWAKDWLASEALRICEDALTKSNRDVVAVVASNDATAGGAVSALETAGVAGKVLVSGQDADLAGLQRIIAGKQSMTVYKPVHLLARRAAEAAVALARGEKVDAPARINNGKIDVPSILLEPVVVDKGNIDDTVVKDGYQKKEAIYQNAPVGSQ
ncbi:MAG: D-xylose transport system substrate-binding protein [Acidobacteriota bacterium]|jgi:D-xylose transport system substrate-binding protein|nr:D-xylose transport system substrate-binding protein [Acidobacteriota bacterium]